MALEQRRRGRAIEQHPANTRVRREQRWKIVRAHAARDNGGVEAARSFARGQHVPQRKSSDLQPQQSIVVGQGRIETERLSNEGPELVARVGVIACRLQRGQARHAAKDQAVRPVRQHWRETFNAIVVPARCHYLAEGIVEPPDLVADLGLVNWQKSQRRRQVRFH